MNKLETLTNLFEGKEIRSVWDKDKEEYYFSVVDVIGALTESTNPRNYWNMLKSRLTNDEGSELYRNCVQLKMTAKDGKLRETDTLDTKGILRLIESVPSPKAEPFKVWLANLGSERIDEVFDPSLAITRAIEYYHKKGYDDNWIEARIKSIIHRKQLTESWKENGVNDGLEFALLTNQIYQTWSGMKANEYKEFKGLRKENLRDNMSDIEVLLNDLGEVTTRDIVLNEHPKGFKNNMKAAKRGGRVAFDAKTSYESATKKSAITSKNNINYKYIDENKKIEEKI